MVIRSAETLVIGASAAGLATAACLRRAGREVEILEAADAVGPAWRHHYDRLHLHTPKSGSALPGLPMPRSWPRYPSRDQVVDYLERYRLHHHLEPRFGARVTWLDRRDGEWPDGGWFARTADGDEWSARTVVVATGANRRPVRPTWPGTEAFGGRILHSSEYRNGSEWAGRTVVVVGFGNSACEQAVDLVEHGARPHLAIRSAVNVIPRDLLGVPVLRLGIAMRPLPPAVADALSRPLIRLAVGDLARVGLRRLPYGPTTQMVRHHRIPLLDAGTMAHLRAGRIRVHPGVERFTERGVVFAGGETLDADAVVLATGYRPCLEEFLVPWRDVCGDDGVPRASGAPTALDGLYFCGQYVSPAGMLREIGIEARRIADHVARS